MGLWTYLKDLDARLGSWAIKNREECDRLVEMYDGVPTHLLLEKYRRYQHSPTAPIMKPDARALRQVLAGRGELPSPQAGQDR